MFTGIIETMARLESAEKQGSNLDFIFSSSIAQELKVDQSLAHNGVCLTVTAITDNTYSVTAIQETLKRSNLGRLTKGDLVNLERCMPANGRFDGHIVQGHVDTVATCKTINDLNGSWEFVFEHARQPDHITVKKGSVTVNGVSLTVVDAAPSHFSVHLIPYTYQHTNFRNLRPGDQVNIEFDIVGKYIARLVNQ